MGVIDLLLRSARPLSVPQILGKLRAKLAGVDTGGRCHRAPEYSTAALTTFATSTTTDQALPPRVLWLPTRN